MRDYVKMYNTEPPTDKGCNLISECLPEDEANEFAEIFEHNYGGNVIARPTGNNDDWVVFADGVRVELVRANFNSDYGHYVFAAWKYGTRNHGNRR